MSKISKRKPKYVITITDAEYSMYKYKVLFSLLKTIISQLKNNTSISIVIHKNY